MSRSGELIARRAGRRQREVARGPPGLCSSLGKEKDRVPARSSRTSSATPASTASAPSAVAPSVCRSSCDRPPHSLATRAQASKTNRVAARAGLTVDRLDDRHRSLERAGVLHVQRRRAANGGRHLPSTYTIREAPRPQADQPGPPAPPAPHNGTVRAEHQYWQGGEPVPARPQNGPRRPADGYRRGGGPVLAGPRTGTGRAADGYRQGGDSATLSTASPPSNARGGQLAVEKDVETPPPTVGRETRGEGATRAARQELCEALLAAWEPALGHSPRRAYQADQARWLAAAGELLARHPRRSSTWSATRSSAPER